MALRKQILRAIPFIAVAALVGCGGSPADDALKVSAASSLKKAVTQIAGSYNSDEVQLEFAGSDAIATAIRAGRKPDALLAASLKIPAKLAAENLVQEPIVFARNRVVVAVAASNTSIEKIEDLGNPGVTIAIGTASVPIGAYADKVIAALPAATQARIRANVKTREPDAASVSSKVTSGSVQAAILYETDVKATKGALKVIEIPTALGSMTHCAAVAVKGTGHEAAAVKFIENLLTPQSQKTLVQNGFLPAPPS